MQSALIGCLSSTAPLGLTPEPALLLLAQYTVPADDRILIQVASMQRALIKKEDVAYLSYMLSVAAGK